MPEIHALTTPRRERLDRYESFERVAIGTSTYGPAYYREGPLAVVPVRGSIGRSWMADITVDELMAVLGRIIDDDRVETILLDIDSGGGESSALSDLHDAMREVRNERRVVGIAHDTAASLACQMLAMCHEAYATPDAIVGSLGTISVSYDITESMAKQGVRPVVARSGELKGAGVPGVAISEEMRASEQAWVDEHYARSRAIVAEFRGIDQAVIDGLQGRIVSASVAEGLGLIDGVRSYLDLVRSLMQPRASTPQRERSDMIKRNRSTTSPRDEEMTLEQALSRISELEEELKVANSRLSEMEEETPASEVEEETPADFVHLARRFKDRLDADALKSFVFDCVTQGVTLAQAERRYADLAASRATDAIAERDRLRDENERLRQSLDSLGRGLPAPIAVRPGGTPAKTEYEDAVRARMAAGLARDDAMLSVSREQPALREDWLRRGSPAIA